MNQKKLEAGDPLKIGDTTLIPVAEICSFSNVQGEKAAFVGRKRATAVVVLGPSGTVALNVEGDAVSLSDLLNEVTGLKERMAEIPGSGVQDK